MKKRMCFSLLIATLLILAGWEAQVWGYQGFVMKVNCTAGQTITRALQGCYGIPITVKVKGTCNENVEIVRDDVTLIPDPLGGTVIGLDPNLPTINVRAFRTVIDGLTVSGGGHGIFVRGGATIRNCTIQNTGPTGISFFHGGNGTVDNCTVQSNGGMGVSIAGGSATVINSAISSSAAGIVVSVGGSARIGITERNQYAGNTISNNQGSGIIISTSGSAHIGGNKIEGNGKDPNSLFAWFGILVDSASAILVGNNSITGNSGSGVFAQCSSGVSIGNPALGLPITNSITGNGTMPNVPNGGIFGIQGASFELRSTTISNNTGDGINLQLRSTARIYDGTVQNNAGNGILLGLGGGLLLHDPAVTVSGNTQYGLFCFDNESSFYGNTSGILGGIVNCTGF
jgi:parallel beta-helix repeat protein